MKKYLLVLVLIVILVLGYQVRNSRLKSQLLEETVSPEKAAELSTPCDLSSEDVANTCLRGLAIEKNDASFCDRISKSSLRSDCRRELELMIPL